MRASGGAKAVLLGLGDRSIDRHSGDAAGRGLDDAGLDPGLADALGQLLDIDLGDVVGSEHPEMLWDTERVIVEASGDDDAHAGFLRHLGGELRIAAEFHWAWIDETLDPEILDLLHPIDRLADFGLANKVAIVELPAGEARGQMLVDKREAQVACFAFTDDGVNRHS